MTPGLLPETAGAWGTALAPPSTDLERGAPVNRLCPIVMACDENFAMPLTTALRSLVESNVRQWPIDVTVLTDGFSAEAKDRVCRSLPQGSASVRWALIDLTDYVGFTPMAYLSRMTYARFQIARQFGDDVGRVLYIDADTLVLGDLSSLAQVDLGDCAIAAVPDHHIDGAHQRGEIPHPGGLPKVRRYFNAGVLVIDMPAWRRDRVAERAVEFLKEVPNTPYADQDALNVACDGAWVALPTRWNFQDHLRTAIGSMPRDSRPAIAHFITAAKPWKPEAISVNSQLYGFYRDRTEFRQNAAQRLLWRLIQLRVRCKNKLERMVRALVSLR